jgi:hypothetical protein
MQPILDISKKNAFTVWESGHWNRNKSFGVGILCAGPSGEQLQVIFDKNPKIFNKTALFSLELSNILIGSYVRESNGQLTFDLEILRISSLEAPLVQGHPVPRFGSDILYLAKKRTTVEGIEDLLKDFEEIPSIPNAKELLSVAISKSLTEQSGQYIFWGIPRGANNELC